MNYKQIIIKIVVFLIKEIIFAEIKIYVLLNNILKFLKRKISKFQ